MGGSCFGIVSVGVFALAIVLIIVGAQQNRKRQAAPAAWAQSRGLSFDPGHDGGFRDRFPEFACFKQGEKNRYALNVMTGQWNSRRLIGFYYHYQTTSTNSKGHTTTSTWYFSGALIEPRILLKPLSIRTESIFDKMAGFFGFDDIDFESAEFSRRFCVKSPDRRWAYDVLHARTIEFLLQSPRFTIDFARDWALVWKSGRFKPQEFEQAIAVVEGVLDRLPDYLVQQQKTLMETSDGA